MESGFTGSPTSQAGGRGHNVVSFTDIDFLLVNLILPLDKLNKMFETINAALAEGDQRFRRPISGFEQPKNSPVCLAAEQALSATGKKSIF